MELSLVVVVQAEVVVLQVHQEVVGHQEQVEHLVHRVVQEVVVPLVQVEHQVQVVLQEVLVHLVQVEPQGLQEHQVRQVVQLWEHITH